MSASDKPLCCQHSEILVGRSGKVSFGFGCVIHPRAKIIVEGDCSVIFGEYNIIEENVTIKATPRYSALLNNEETVTVYIGNYNYFKVGAYLENTTVENFNEFDYACHLQDSYVTSKSFICAGVTLPKGTTVKPNLIILDNNQIVNNSNFNEIEFTKKIKELHKVLVNLLPKGNKILPI